MSYRNAIADILTGSRWISERGDTVRVVQAAAGHVTFYTGVSTACVPEAAFRAAFEPLYDRAAVRQQFTMSCANLGEFRAFWVPDHRRIACRSVSCSRQFRVPPGALEIGVYSAPCATDTFFEDLDDLLTRSCHETREPAPAAATGRA